MGFLCRASLAVFVVFVAFSAYKFRESTKPIEAPKFDLNQYWGPGKKSDYKENTEVVKYEISFPDKVSTIRLKTIDNNGKSELWYYFNQL